MGKPKGGPTRGLIVCGALADAVRRESNQAVCFLWGVTPQTVTKWRKALEVGRRTEGSTRLRSDYFLEPWAREAQANAHANGPRPQTSSEDCDEKNRQETSGRIRRVHAPADARNQAERCHATEDEQFTPCKRHTSACHRCALVRTGRQVIAKATGRESD